MNAAPQPMHKIITHVNPDLDSMLGILLLREFGEALFPNVAQAEVQFVSAGDLPEGKTARELEKEGVLAVDVGGGRFDSHPDAQHNEGKQDRSATDLIAEALGVLHHPDWEQLIEYARLQDTKGHSLHSKKQEFHLISLQTILLGLSLLYGEDSAGKLEAGISIVSTIPFFNHHAATAYKPLQLQKPIEDYFAKREIDLDNPAPHLTQLATWVKTLRENPQGAFPSKNKMDRMVSMKAVLLGAGYQHEAEPEKAQAVIDRCLDAIIARELEWHTALEEYEGKALVRDIQHIRVVSIESPSGMVMKVARFKHRPDIIIYRNPINQGTTVFIQRKGQLEHYNFRKLAAYVRVAECVAEKVNPDYSLVEAVGKHHGWFLHQSENLLIKGSLKETNFSPSKLSLEVLSQIVYALFDGQERLKLPPAHANGIIKYTNPLFR